MSLFGMVRGLNEAGVRYVVIGGVAGVAHGSSRVTNDLDICYDSLEDNRERLAALLGEWNAYLRDVDAGLPFILDARTLADSAVLTLSTREGELDVFAWVNGVGDYAACRARSESVKVDDLTIAVLDLPALIATKRAAGRPKDIEALRELEALLELKKQAGPAK
jgi:predicted nucleotidyltransferase